jgi:hypothetical protein
MMVVFWVFTPSSVVFRRFGRTSLPREQHAATVELEAVSSFETSEETATTWHKI